MLRFLDGLYHLDASQFGQKWGVVGAAVQRATGRFDAYGWNSAAGSDLTTSELRTPVLNVSGPEGYLGLALVQDSPPSCGGFDHCVLLHVRDAAGGILLQVSHTNANTFRIWRGTGTILVSGTLPFVTGTWTYLEFGWRIADSGGFAELRYNDGTTSAELHYAGDTQAGNFTVWQSVSFYVGSAARADDVYVLDAGTGVRKYFLGPCKVLTAMPDAPGAHTGFAVAGAATNREAVDEAPHDGEGTYVSGTDNAHKDTYEFQDISTQWAIFGGQLNILGRAVSAVEPQGVVPVVIEDAGEAEGAVQAVTSTLSRDYRQIYEQRPAAGPWTTALANGAQFGMRRQS